MSTATDTVILKKRRKNLILWIAGYGILFTLLYYADILETTNPVFKFLIIFYSVFAIPVIYSTLTAKASITNHTLYYKGNSPQWISFKKKYAIPLKNATEIFTAFSSKANVLNFKMTDGKIHRLCIEYFLKKDLFHVLNQMLSSTIVQKDDAAKFSLHIHPVTGLFSGTAKDLEIYINGHPVSRDTAQSFFRGQACHGDLLAISKGDNFIFKYLDDAEDVEYVLELPTTLIKTRPEDVKTTIKRSRILDAIIVIYIFLQLIAVCLWGNKALWLLPILLLIVVIYSFMGRKK